MTSGKYKHEIKMNCLICKKEILKKVNNQKYCNDCSHLQELNQKANWKIRNKEKVSLIDKKYSKLESTKKKKKLKMIQYRKKNKFKTKARNKSRIIKIPLLTLCEVCKINIAKEKHHKDYLNPLEIQFLCKSCHEKIHSKEVKERDGKRIYKYN